jgi:nucleoid-associated protein YgaU
MPKSFRIILAVGACIAAFLVVYFAATPSLSDRPGEVEFDEGPATEETIPVDPLASGDDAEVPPVEPDARQPTVELGPQDPASGEAPDADDQAPLPPGFTIHVVRRGETMQSIAEAIYGDAGRWTLIAHENPFEDPIKLTAGTELRIPPADHRRPGEPEDVDHLPQAPTIHVVKKNETLGHIAQLHYGEASKWRLIFEANRDKLDTPDMVRAGMKLTIPPDFEADDDG